MPWKAAIDMVKSGPAERGCLEKIDEKNLRILSVTKYSLPKSTVELASQCYPDSIRQMLDNCQPYRKNIWQLLEKQIKRTIKDSTEQDDMDFD